MESSYFNYFFLTFKVRFIPETLVMEEKKSVKSYFQLNFLYKLEIYSDRKFQTQNKFINARVF